MTQKTLVYGYGNVGRKDDGLGVLAANAIEQWAKTENFSWLDVETNYQLNIEDAEIISNYDVVYFVDASLEEIEDVSVTEVSPDDNKIEFSMHAVSPAYVLKLCKDMFKKSPKTFLVHLKGYDWDFVEGLSPQGEDTLEKGISALKDEISVLV